MSASMHRRAFITLLGGAAAWPIAATAQQGERARLIGVLMATAQNDPESRSRSAAFEDALAHAGWQIGHNLQIDYHWGISDDDRARAAAAELLRRMPDVILANASTATAAAQRATATVPIVFTVVSEPVAQGFVASLARPGGNLTGFTNLEPSVGGKWLELLKRIAPSVQRASILFNPKVTPIAAEFARSAAAAAHPLGVEATITPVHEAMEIEAAVALLANGQDGGLILAADNFISFHRRLIIDLAARYRLPAIYYRRDFAMAGGLLSYGIDLDGQLRQAADYVDRILRGARPAELPVQQPTKFELVINLKTARALGLMVPDTLIALADEVIEQ
jgi:putative ABC transport system substrate-binding protein